jgi:2-polyprenyl-3-methyl-5-hydroxy-6-metoxy-1,4-benzoquinol methylase
MNSKEIAKFIGKNAWRRKLAYFFINATTLREWYIRKALRQIFSMHEGKFSFLDAGSGLGQHSLSVALKVRRAKVTGIELDEEQAADCREFTRKNDIGNAEFYCGDISRLSFHEAFDVVLCSSVLEHIEDDAKVLRTFNQAIRENGHLVIYVPTSEERVLPWLRRTIHLMVRRNRESLPHGHVRYYQPAELIGKLQSANFDVTSATVSYGPYGRLAYDIVTSIQYSSLFKLLFPLYFVMLHPLVLLLMWADFKKNNRSGNGLLIVARKGDKLDQRTSAIPFRRKENISKGIKSPHGEGNLVSPAMRSYYDQATIVQ